MFKKILIANRGEIACRIMRTASRLGIETVAIYSDADRDAKHVSLADEAVAIGGTLPRESYLNIDKILKAARDSGAEAIHPGYGFLSENAEFAKRVQEAGLIFIGPSPEAITIMGDKIAAKKCATRAGVSILPGTEDPLERWEDARQIAGSIGYPIILKAAAGGGGKGMRVVHHERDLAEAFDRATSEALSSFGDGRVFLEKYIENPRHIEIQILADSFGHTLYLGERECSLQRRHQKVIEEAPSPFVDEAMRRSMGEQAVALAREVGYVSAGTVEFIVSPAREFYFLEMNTRLQVEHPVTEYVTGLDLVESMIRIAAGEPLPLTQADIKLRGHAIESRIYAEDSARGFLPSSGRLVYYRPPATTPHVRLDDGVDEGDAISTFYDPMIGKLITYGETREAARLQMIAALGRFYVEGLSTNIDFLGALCQLPAFIQGEAHTHTIGDLFPEGYHPTGADINAPLFASIGTLLEHLSSSQDFHEGVVLGNDGELSVTLQEDGPLFEVTVEDQKIILETSWKPGDFICEGLAGGEPFIFQVKRTEDLGWRLSSGGVACTLRLLPPHVAELAHKMPPKPVKDTSRLVRSPMPGLIVDIHAALGQKVKAGDPIAVVEAMKMENVIRAERDGTIASLLVSKGENVILDQKLAEIA